MGLTKYLKAAFFNQWNMLAFLGGMGFALLLHPYIVGPLVLAAEVAYLGFLGTHPKFQKYVEAQDAKVNRQEGKAMAQETARRILKELPKKVVQRFEALRTSCAELRQISLRMREPEEAVEPVPLEGMQLASLDRLLWMYLRLLYTQFALSQFLAKTSDTGIQGDINLLEERLQRMAEAGADDRQQRVRKVVEENLQMSRVRLENYKKAQDNYDLMGLELDRLENTIRSLSELAVNRHEPNFISGQIDQVAASMVQTERTMGELQFVTGLTSAEDDVVPPILQRETQ